MQAKLVNLATFGSLGNLINLTINCVTLFEGFTFSENLIISFAYNLETFIFCEYKFSTLVP